MSFQVRVYIEDTEAAGGVHHANYLKYMERARTEFMRTAGFGKTAIFAEEMMFVVADCQAQFLSHAELDDLLEVTAKPIKVARTNIVFSQQVWLRERLLVDGRVRIACVSRSDYRPCPMPETMLAAVKRLLDSAE